tara:strand:+ start:156 stop:557 length:402 start_codon:yes stop_codon:yes gene_type:complete
MITKKIIFYDGHCNLCNGFVNAIIKLDKKNIFLFAPLNGNHAKNLLKKNNIKNITVDSVVLFNNNSISYKSKAVIEILISLGGIYRVLVMTKIIPRAILDWLYNIVAKNRYSWFGKQDRCMVPDKKIISKFLD